MCCYGVYYIRVPILQSLQSKLIQIKNLEPETEFQKILQKSSGTTQCK